MTIIQSTNQTSKQSNLSADQNIAFVQAGWHSEIVEQSRISFTEQLVPKWY